MPNAPVDVIIVEDNSLFRQTLAKLLMQSDQTNCYHTFTSAEDAISSIDRDELVPDIILLDIGLPGMNGVDAIPVINALSPSTKIIMLTIHDDDENIFKAICAGASGYLLKDRSAEEIVTDISGILNGAAPMNAHIAARVLDLFKRIAAPSADYGLTTREKEILKLMVDGFLKKEIAGRLYLSFHTVDSHVRNIYHKLAVHSRTGAVAKALRERLF